MNAPTFPPLWPMYRALVGVGMICGLMIAVVYAGTRPVIERNRAEALERAVFHVLPEASQRVTYTLEAGGGFSLDPNAGTERVHAGFDVDGRLVGVAIEASGMGYADLITILYGYAPGTETIVGFRVLGSKETPGLGDKIEKDERFLANFEALDVRLDDAGAAPANPIVTVKQGEKTEAWQIDGITGATISSVAIGDMLAASTAHWAPVITGNLEAFSAGGDDDGT